MRQELIEAGNLIKADRPGAVEEALRLLQKTVYSFSMKVCGHPEDAEDTMQDVLLKSIPYLRKIESPQALAVWLYKVTRNRCWMSRRRSKFAPTQTLALDELMPDSAELQALTARPEESPESQLISAESEEKLRQAVLRIPPNYRLVLVLHDMEELDTSEVAKITGLREGTVRVRLHRARLFVRRELATPSAAPAPGKRKKATKPVACREMFARLSEYIDGRMDQLSCERIQKHLHECPQCLAFVADLERAIDRCRSYETPCPPAISEKIQRLLVEEYLRFSLQTK